MGRLVPDETDSPFELADKGLFARAAEAADRIDRPSPGLLVLRAELEAHIASPSSARRRAESLLASDISHRERARCLSLVGIAALKSGQTRKGMRTISQGLETAIATGDSLLEARLRERFISSLLHGISIEAACVELPKLRKLAMRAGDARSLAVFHILAGAVSSRRGQFAIAHAHFETSRGLLSTCASEWLRGRLAVVSAATCLLQSNYTGAGQHIEIAYAAARLSGSREILIPAIGNFAIVALAERRLDQARALLEELLTEVRKGGNASTELTVHSHLLQLAMAEGDESKATAVNEAASRLIANAEGVSVDQLWFLLDRARLQYVRGNLQSGLTIALDALPLIERLCDIDLWRRMRLVAAEGYGKLGRPLEGAALVIEVLSEPPAPSIEIVAEASRVIGHLTRDDVRASRFHFMQAARVFSGIGNVNAASEVQNTLKSLAGSAEDTTGCEVEPSSIFDQCDRIVSVLQAGTLAPLLARELVSLIASSELFLSATTLEIRADGTRRPVATYEAHGGRHNVPGVGVEHINLGSLGGNSYELVATPKPTARGMSAAISLKQLAQTATLLSRAHQLERDSDALIHTESFENQLGIVCTSDQTKELISSIRQVADTNVTVLLGGETGVGKELFARALHAASPRNRRTFLPFNCSTVPREMIDSQLFGHKRGSFTGAIGDSLGVIRSAAGGTLFLDEIGEMALESQPKLLRFLESGEILPLGETKPLHVDVRVVAATNADLDRLVADGRFREDLFYRLNVIRINIPPLRERREEIPALVAHFLERFSREHHKPMLRVADETLEYLVLYRWPGNVRQLANEVRRLVAMSEPGTVIMPAHLANDIFESRRTLPVNRSPRLFDEVVARIDQPLTAVVEHVERAAIQRALAMTNGHLDEAARILGLSRKGLYLKRQRLNLG